MRASSSAQRLTTAACGSCRTPTWPWARTFGSHEVSSPTKLHDGDFSAEEARAGAVAALPGEALVGQQVVEVAPAARVHVVVAVERPGRDPAPGVLDGHRPPSVVEHVAVVLLGVAGVVDVAEVHDVRLAAVREGVADLAGHESGDRLGALEPRSPVAHDHDPRVVGDLVLGGDRVERAVALGEALEHRLGDLGDPLGIVGPVLRRMDEALDLVPQPRQEAVAVRVRRLVADEPLLVQLGLDGRLQQADDRVAADERVLLRPGRRLAEAVGRHAVGDLAGGVRCGLVARRDRLRRGRRRWAVERPRLELPADRGRVPAHHVSIGDVIDHDLRGIRPLAPACRLPEISHQ